MRIRRTPQELAEFNKVVKEYTDEGYPIWRAQEIAWDIIHTERQIRGFKPRKRVSA